MEKKEYPVMEEEDGYGPFTAAEPAAVASFRGTYSPHNYLADIENEDADRIPLGMFGFYTDDPSVFEQRVAEMEADLDEVDAGFEDSEKWIQVDDFWAEMKRKHPWL